MGETRTMLARALLLSLLAASACGPAASTGDDDGADAPPGALDARPFADAPPAPIVMYAHSRDTLYAIDDTSFALTTIGSFGTSDLITDLAVTSDGTLYGISKTELYRIDGATGLAARIASVPGLENVGLTFLPDDTLLATDKAGGVRRVNPATGQVTEIGAFGGGYATAGDLVAVADGTMYAISDEGPVGDEFDDNLLLTVNTANGSAAPVGQIGFGQVFGVAYANGHVYAFNNAGKIIEIDRATGAGTERASHPVEFWGAGVSPLVPLIP